VHIRPATSADLLALVNVDAHARDGDAERISFIGTAVASGRCLLADDGQPLGYVITTPRHFFGSDFVDLLRVIEERRCEGIGQLLLRSAVVRSQTPRVFSSTNESNEPMRALFTRERWSFSGRLDGLDEGDPELVYFIDKQ
jgi:hypothetical protein